MENVSKLFLLRNIFCHTPELPLQDSHPTPSREFLQRAITKVYVQYIYKRELYKNTLPSCSQAWQCLILPQRPQASLDGCAHPE